MFSSGVGESKFRESTKPTYVQLQVIGQSDRKSPLPALVRFVCDPEESVENPRFYSISKNFYDHNESPDPQLEKRSYSAGQNLEEYVAHLFFMCGLTKTFSSLQKQTAKDSNGVYIYRFPSAPMTIARDVEKHLTELHQEITQDSTFADLQAFKNLDIEALALMCLEASETVRAHANWNSHAALVLSSMSNFAALLLDCRRHEVHKSRRTSSIVAQKLTGQMPGSASNVYIEYMVDHKTTAAPVSNVETMATEENLQEVAKLFATKNANEYPTPRPTTAKCPDMVVSYLGCPIAYGECKSTKDTEGGFNKGIDDIVLISSKCLAYGKVGLALHSSDNSFKFFKLVKCESEGERATGVIKVFKRYSPEYVLKTMSSPHDDPTDRKMCKDAPFRQPNPDEPSVLTDLYKMAQESYVRLPYTCRKFLTAFVFGIDVVTGVLEEIEVKSVFQKYEDSYKLKNENPTRWDVGQSTQRRHIKNPWRFQFCPSTLLRLKMTEEEREKYEADIADLQEILHESAANCSPGLATVLADMTSRERVLKLWTRHKTS